MREDGGVDLKACLWNPAAAGQWKLIAKRRLPLVLSFPQFQPSQVVHGDYRTGKFDLLATLPEPAELENLLYVNGSDAAE